MTVKIRKQIYIEPDQEAILKRLSQETGLSAAEIIRQAIDDHARSIRHPRHDVDVWRKERAFIAGLKERRVIEGRRTWQRDDLHER